ncbi:hypothetical protein EAS62_28115 [Bradyrhizobium zhanjiangense]|uniref:Uncharacterized protein n=1 Tax=Bradyrhizobium zhanjiangense TaxID=1325107 RepID=A0ABY0DE30_9BRAD|nr:hypothetical protein EAS62_28115 [Bradyrhizobium zhanjiangense]
MNLPCAWPGSSIGRWLAKILNTARRGNSKFPPEGRSSGVSTNDRRYELRLRMKRHSAEIAHRPFW